MRAAARASAGQRPPVIRFALRTVFFPTGGAPRELVTCLAGGGLCIAATGRIDATPPAVATLSIAVGLIMPTSTAYRAWIPLVVPGRTAGATSGPMHGLGSLSGIVAPALTGFIIERTHRYAAAFEIAGGLAVLGALAVACPIRDRTSNAALCEITQRPIALADSVTRHHRS